MQLYYYARSETKQSVFEFISVSTEIMFWKINIKVIDLVKLNCATSVGSSGIFASSIIASFDVNADIYLGVVKQGTCVSKK